MTRAIDPKTLHVVAYTQRPNDTERELVGTARVSKTREVIMHRGGRGAPDAPLISRLARRGQVAVAMQGEGDAKSRLGTLAPGETLTVEEDNGVTLTIEARQVVEEAGRVLTPKAISPTSLRALEAQVRREKAVWPLRIEARAARDRWVTQTQSYRARLVDEIKDHKVAARGTPIADEVSEILDARLVALDAIIARMEERSAALLRDPELNQAKLERYRANLESSRARVAEHTKVAGARRALTEGRTAATKLERLAKSNPGAAYQEHVQVARAGLDMLWRGVPKRLRGSNARLPLQETLRAVAKLDSPGWSIRGTVTVTAVRDKNILTHWVVRFENKGDQAFVGTVVIAGGDKNDGIGFESMGLPARGCGAEQIIVLNGHYGARPQPGVPVRFGVRSHGWCEVPLPRTGSVTVDIGDFTVENDGADRGEDYDAKFIRGKRKEKYLTGKVRFFENGRPWAPARVSR